MNLQETRRQALKEFDRDGNISKGVRLEVIERAREGHSFSLLGSHYDANRLRAAIAKTDATISVEQIEQGKKYRIYIN